MALMSIPIISMMIMSMLLQVLHELKQELVDYEEDVGQMAEVAASSGRKGLGQSKGAARLFKKVNSMLGKVDSVVTKLETRKTQVAKNIDLLQQEGERSEAQEGHLVTVQVGGNISGAF